MFSFNSAATGSVLLVLVSVAPAASAALLVDTGSAGTSSIGSTSLFNSAQNGSYQYLSGQFVLTEGALIDSLDGWMGPNSAGGEINLKLYANTNTNLPGATLYSKTFNPGFRGTAGWETFSGFNAALPAGTYWMSFEPAADGFSGTMPSGAPNPLPKTAFYGNGNSGWVSLGKTLGMRVDGRTSNVIMGSAARGTTRQDVPINGDPNGLAAQTGGNGVMTTNASVGDGAGRGVVGADGLEAGAFARGSHDAPGGPSIHFSVGTGHGVAWRPYVNDSNQPQTFKINGVLEGAANNDFGSLDCWVDARVSALDPEKLANAVGASGVDAGTYLLDRHTDAGNYQSFPAGMALQDKVLNDLFVADSSGNQPKNYNLSTGLFTLDPGESFIMLFDVFVQTTGQASGGGSGVVDFLNTLRPATDLFTDANGAAVTGITAGSIQTIDVPEPTSLLAAAASLGMLMRRRR